jgi:pimeloyl-CoA synthetase
MLFHLKEATKHLNFLKIKKIVLILSTLCLFHCEKDISSIPSQQISEPLTQNKNLRIDVSNKETDEPLELGEKLINPYSINNMEKSLNILKEKKLAKSDFIVHVNYLYVRILPENEEQFKLINSDPELD